MGYISALKVLLFYQNLLKNQHLQWTFLLQCLLLCWDVQMLCFLHKVNISSNLTPMPETRRLTLSSQKAICKLAKAIPVTKAQHGVGRRQMRNSQNDFIKTKITITNPCVDDNRQTELNTQELQD